MRGEFLRADGLVIPNNISIAGAQMILAAALRNTVPTLYAGLVSGAPTADMTQGAMDEPTIGTNGYARIAIARNDTDWPTLGISGVEAYMETKWLTWLPTGGNFNQAIQRVMLVGGSTYSGSDPVYALSSPLDAALTLTPTTDESLRKFKYRIYL